MIHSALVQGVLSGLLAAALVDLHSWKSWSDAEFNIKTASFRWAVGALTGLATALSLKGLGA